MNISDLYRNSMSKKYCIRTVRITKEQLKKLLAYNTKEFKYEINIE